MRNLITTIGGLLVILALPTGFSVGRKDCSWPHQNATSVGISTDVWLMRPIFSFQIDGYPLADGGDVVSGMQKTSGSNQMR